MKSFKAFTETPIDEACWKGYEKKGMKTMFGKRYPNCVKKKATRKEETEVASQTTPDPNLKSKEKKQAQIKKMVLRKKMQAVRAGAGSDIVASHEPSGEMVEGSLHKWFSQSKSKDGKPGWVQSDGSPCANEPGETKTPKCYSSAKRASMSKKELRSADARKARKDPNQQQKSGAAKPTYVATDKKKVKEENEVDECWKTHKKVGMKMKGGKMVPDCRPKNEEVEIQEKSAAWQRKEGKNKTGGLNEKGRKSYERENPGSDLKAPQPEGGPRKRSFCARMGGMKGPMKDEKGRPTRKALALRKWKC